LTGQWAARVRHLLLFVATALTLFQSLFQEALYICIMRMHLGVL